MNHPTVEPSLGEQAEVHRDATGQKRRTAADQHGNHEHVQLVHHSCRDGLRSEVSATNAEVTVFGRLPPPDRVRG